MELLSFSICDLGPAPSDFYDCWGATFQSQFDDSVIGTGKTAHEAFNNALDQLAMLGFGTKLLHETGVEYGFFSGAASVEASEIEPHFDPEEGEDLSDDLYHVGIRFQSLDDEEEVAVP
jgi:hypothetical protein